MRERQIRMSAPEVRAILAGTKTQTRRVVKPRKDPDYGCCLAPSEIAGDENRARLCPYGQPGDRLWVREAWRVAVSLDSVPPRDLPPGCEVWHEATSTARMWRTTVGKLRPGMFMPRWASRITLRITDVRVERLQDISPEDCQAEGVSFHHSLVDARRAKFRGLWESINGPGSWDANPWVWVICFEKEAGNV